MNPKLIPIIIVSFLLLQSCKSKKRAVAKKRTTQTEKGIVERDKQPVKVVTPAETKKGKVKKATKNRTYAERVTNYIDTYSTIAKEEMVQYGIPASITLAQAVLESGAGNGELTQKAKNHFGIKCHTSWTGERVYHDDDEKGECFRKYKDPKYSFRDHSLFLSKRSRYQNLFKLKKDDYKGWARGLKKAGYATDPKYPDKLISIIHRYNLTQYDDEVLGGKVKKTPTGNEEEVVTYAVKRGDTLYNISRRFNITVETLKEYNGLSSNSISIGQVLYLHPVNGH